MAAPPVPLKLPASGSSVTVAIPDIAAAGTEADSAASPLESAHNMDPMELQTHSAALKTARLSKALGFDAKTNNSLKLYTGMLNLQRVGGLQSAKNKSAKVSAKGFKYFEIVPKDIRLIIMEMVAREAIDAREVRFINDSDHWGYFTPRKDGRIYFSDYDTKVRVKQEVNYLLRYQRLRIKPGGPPINMLAFALTSKSLREEYLFAFFGIATFVFESIDTYNFRMAMIGSEMRPKIRSIELMLAPIGCLSSDFDFPERRATAGVSRLELIQELSFTLQQMTGLKDVGFGISPSTTSHRGNYGRQRGTEGDLAYDLRRMKGFDSLARALHTLKEKKGDSGTLNVMFRNALPDDFRYSPRTTHRPFDFDVTTPHPHLIRKWFSVNHMQQMERDLSAGQRVHAVAHRSVRSLPVRELPQRKSRNQNAKTCETIASKSIYRKRKRVYADDEDENHARRRKIEGVDALVTYSCRIGHEVKAVKSLIRTSLPSRSEEEDERTYL